MSSKVFYGIPPKRMHTSSLQFHHDILISDLYNPENQVQRRISSLRLSKKILIHEPITSSSFQRHLK